jgi:hypothetical protein
MTPDLTRNVSLRCPIARGLQRGPGRNEEWCRKLWNISWRRALTSHRYVILHLGERLTMLCPPVLEEPVLVEEGIPREVANLPRRGQEKLPGFGLRRHAQEDTPQSSRMKLPALWVAPWVIPHLSEATKDLSHG